MKVIKETTLHPEGNDGVDLYPKTNINQVQELPQKLTSVENQINQLNIDKLTKPTTPTAESAVTMLADGTVGTKPLSEIGGGGGIYRHNITFTISKTSPPHKYIFYFESSQNTLLTKTNIFEKFNELAGLVPSNTDYKFTAFTYPVNSCLCSISFNIKNNNTALDFISNKYDGTLIDELHLNASDGIPETVSITDVAIEH